MVDEGNRKLTAEEFLTMSLFNIPLANTKCSVTHKGNGKEKKRRLFGE
jgi:hypothetical protein